MVPASVAHCLSDLQLDAGPVLLCEELSVTGEFSLHILYVARSASD